MKIVLLGGSGLFGSTFIPIIGSTDHTVITIGRSTSNDYKCNVEDLDALSNALNEIAPDVILNLIAITDVDMCERDPKQAYFINVKILENVVNWIESNSKNCHLIQISTDHVYCGQGPHDELNVMLTNYYSFSKYAAELVCLRVKSAVLRTNFFGRSKRKNRLSFTDWLYNSIINNEPISVFNDVFFSPLSMNTLSKMIIEVINTRLCGVYNLGSNYGMSKSDFCFHFIKLLNMKSNNIDIVSIDDVSFIKTYRPKDMRLDVSKFEKKMGIKLPSLENEIKTIIGEYNEQA